jgi:hypothetical protein
VHGPQDLQVLQDVNGSLTEDVFRGGMERLGKDKVRVLAQANDQQIGGEDSLDEIHLLPDSIVSGDKWDVLIALVMDKTGQGMVGSRAAVQSGWVRVGMEECVANIPFEQGSAVCGTDVRHVVRECRGL